MRLCGVGSRVPSVSRRFITSSSIETMGTHGGSRIGDCWLANVMWSTIGALPVTRRP